ncbi:MAG: NAD-dependent epimerase/dehydratase family protein [Candidatus Zixiibacteriota bacterium]|nr:MAG: NAD-dependent epimerase/dehydratase family protein [candidate division Zixibacteria bacterium]
MSLNISENKILITGASGSIGKQLIFELHRRGISPVAHVRETSDTSFVDSIGVEKRLADLRDEQGLQKMVEGVDLVFHTAAWVNFRKDRLTQFTGINTFGALNMFRSAQKAGVKRFLHVSTAAAVGAIDRKANGERSLEDSLVREETEFNLGHLKIPYIMTKHAAEQELRKAAQEGPTELVIVNPSVVVAPSSTGDDRGRILKRFNRFVMPDLPVRLNLVDIRDVAPAIISAMCHGRNGERYILAGDNITVRDLVLAVSSIIGKVPHLLRIPRPVYNFTARASIVMGKLVGRGKVSYYPDLVKMLDYDWAYSSKKAREQLDYRCRSIHETLDELLTNNFTGTYLKPGNGPAAR